MSRFGMMAPTPLPDRVGARREEVGRSVVAQQPAWLAAGLDFAADDEAVAARQRGHGAAVHEGGRAMHVGGFGIVQTVVLVAVAEREDRARDDAHPGDGVGVGIHEAVVGGEEGQDGEAEHGDDAAHQGEANDTNQEEETGPQDHAAADDEGRAGVGENERVPEHANEVHQTVGSVLV